MEVTIQTKVMTTTMTIMTIMVMMKTQIHTGLNMGIVIGKAQENLTPNGGVLRILM